MGVPTTRGLAVVAGRNPVYASLYLMCPFACCVPQGFHVFKQNKL